MRAFLLANILGACIVTLHGAVVPKVQVDLYYESLCPYCRNFITKQLWPTYQRLRDILTITLVPYGNASEKKINGTFTFSCQHGAAECYGNVIESCSIKYIADFNVSFPFIYCIEQNITKGPEKAAIECAKNQTVPIDQIMTCAKGNEGSELEHQAAKKTEGLNPPHHYVPWVVVNGVHNEKISNQALTNLTKLVCSFYKGVKPATCLSQQSHVVG